MYVFAIRVRNNNKGEAWWRYEGGCLRMMYGFIFFITLNKIINATLFFLPPFFMSWTQKI